MCLVACAFARRGGARQSGVVMGRCTTWKGSGMSDFKFGGLSVEMQPSITKWGFEDLGDEPDKPRWRAWWADDGISGPEKGLGFRMGGPIRMRQLTDAGREAVKNCPDTFPGEPVYTGRNR
jgi:hypothetical protein